MNKKMTTLRLCMIAMAVCINVAGGQLALMLRLPIYLDSIGTILIGAWMGPFYGMLPNMISGVLMGFTTDIYSLYFAPVGMITGFMAGIAAKQMHGLVFEKQVKKLQIIAGALFITIPGTMVSSGINAVLFGGVTSSGSSILVQILSRTPLGLTGSIFAVQIFTDYLDRVISLALVVMVLQMLPFSMRTAFQKAERK